jgi:hypothetical protein
LPEDVEQQPNFVAATRNVAVVEFDHERLLREWVEGKG